jgi:hypothetical protein
MVINLRLPKHSALDLPSPLLPRADEVIEGVDGPLAASECQADDEGAMPFTRSSHFNGLGARFALELKESSFRGNTRGNPKHDSYDH